MSRREDRPKKRFGFPFAVVDVEPFDERVDAYGALGERKLEQLHVLFPTERAIEEEFDGTDVAPFKIVRFGRQKIERL